MLLDFRVSEGEVEDFLFVFEIIWSDCEGGAEFAVDLDDDGGGIGDEVFVVPGWPFIVGV